MDVAKPAARARGARRAPSRPASIASCTCLRAAERCASKPSIMTSSRRRPPSAWREVVVRHEQRALAAREAARRRHDDVAERRSAAGRRAAPTPSGARRRRSRRSTRRARRALTTQPAQYSGVERLEHGLACERRAARTSRAGRASRAAPRRRRSRSTANGTRSCAVSIGSTGCSIAIIAPQNPQRGACTAGANATAAPHSRTAQDARALADDGAAAARGDRQRAHRAAQIAVLERRSRNARTRRARGSARHEAPLAIRTIATTIAASDDRRDRDLPPRERHLAGRSRRSGR